MLSRPDIIHRIQIKALIFEPEVPDENIAQVSVDLRLGNKFTKFKKPPGYLSQIRVDKSLWDSADLWEHNEQDIYILKPGEFVLARTQEKVVMPHDLVGFIEGRSSWARVGVSIHVTAPKIDPGFEGSITLEMTNFGMIPVELHAGEDKPAQLMFFRISHALEESEVYGCRPSDVFQGQDKPIPTAAP